MPLSQAVLTRQQAAIFDRLGESATWGDLPDPVRVRRSEADEEIRASYSDLVGTGRTLKVRKSEVPAPAVGDQVQILTDDGEAVPDALFEVDGEPMLDRRQVWTCPVRLVAQDES